MTIEQKIAQQQRRYNDSVRRAYGDTLRLMFDYKIPDSERGHPMTMSAGHKTAYACIHLDYSRVVKGLVDAIELLGNRRYEGPRFIDVGCGVGRNLFIASQLGYKSHGIELRENYVSTAKSLLGEYKCEATVEQADAIKYDFRKFDVIYFYCPSYVDEVEREIERAIARTAKKGAVLLAALPRLFIPKGQIYQDKRLQSCHDEVISLGWKEAVENTHEHPYIFQKC